VIRLKRNLRGLLPALAALLAVAVPHVCAADVGLPALTVTGGSGGGQTYTLTLQVLVLMTALSLLPAILLMMTSFTRIMIVLSLLLAYGAFSVVAFAMGLDADDRLIANAVWTRVRGTFGR